MAETEMVERVARALYAATPFKQAEGGYDEQSDVYRRSCLLLARAAIEAMREPTRTMSQAGGEVLLHKECPPWDASDTYRAMIDVALAPPGKEQKS